MSPKTPRYLILMILVITGCASQPIPVQVEQTAEGFRLLRDGQPYRVMGGGGQMADFESLAGYGANSVRTWHVEEDITKGLAVLDHAEALGLTVSLCLNIARERQGFDYDDPDAVAAQLARARSAVLAYRNHPALLVWIIGNELNYDYQNPAVFDAVEDIARMISELDPNHPTTTALAGFDRQTIRHVSERAPSLDFLSFQMYADLINLPRYLDETDYQAPYFVTEWGAIGHWEVGKTAWGAPIEQSSSQKAANYRKSYDRVIASDPHRALGNYVFLWGQKQERTPTWYGLFTEKGEVTEPVDVMYRIWNDRGPKNRSPEVSSLRLNELLPTDNVYLSPGQQTIATVQISDPDGDTISYRWSVKPESNSDAHGGDKEAIISDIDGLIEDLTAPVATITAPQKPGAYRLFVYGSDGRGSAAHANLPFYVSSQPASPQGISE